LKITEKYKVLKLKYRESKEVVENLKKKIFTFENDVSNKISIIENDNIKDFNNKLINNQINEAN